MVLAIAKLALPVELDDTVSGVATSVHPGPADVTLNWVIGGRPDTEKLELMLPWPATGGTPGVSAAMVGLTVRPLPDPAGPGEADRVRQQEGF